MGVGCPGSVLRRGQLIWLTPSLKQAAIEVLVDELRILNTSETPPFPLDEDVEISDNLRLQYRYLDLRRPEMAPKAHHAP